MARSEEHVAAGHDEAAVFGSRQVDVAAPCEPRPIDRDVAVHAEARHSAIGKDPEPHVRRFGRVRDGEQIVRVAVQSRARQYLGP